MAQVFANYNPDRVLLVFAGLQIQGYAPGTFITIRPLTEAFTSRAGADRLVAHTRTNDPRVQIEFVLMSSAAVNVSLSALHRTDLTAPGGAGVGAALLQDLQGSSLVECPYARIMTTPEQQFANDSDSDITWMLEGVLARQTIGGR